MPTLLRTTEGYTGAEIEQAVIDAMYLANAQDKELNNEALVDAVTRITPTSETRREDINQIRSLRDQGFYPANNFDVQEQNGSGRKLAIEDLSDGVDFLDCSCCVIDIPLRSQRLNQCSS